MRNFWLKWRREIIRGGLLFVAVVAIGLWLTNLVRGGRERMVSEFKDRFGAFRHAPVNLDQLNGVRKPVARNVGKSLGDIRALERLVIDDPARVMSPPRDPEPAKAAVAVEDEHRTVRR